MPASSLHGQKATLLPFSELKFLVKTNFSLNDLSLL